MSVSPEQPSRNTKIVAESKLSAAVGTVPTVRRAIQSCIIEPLETRALLSGVSFLGPAQTYPVAGGQGYPVFAEVNGDGNTEVVAGYQRAYGNEFTGNEVAGRITAIVPNTDGSIAATPLSTVYSVSAVRSANSATAISVSNVTGTSTYAAFNTTNHGPDGLLTFVSGDINGDGNPDVVLVKAPYTTYVTTTTRSITSTLTISNSGAILIQNMVANATANFTEYYGPTIEVLTGSPGTTNNNQYTPGAFSVNQSIRLERNPDNKPTSLALGQFTGDGLPDLVLGYSYNNSIAILPGASSGTFDTTALPRIPVGQGPDAIAVGDLSGDGKEDIVVANKIDGTISILFGIGNDQFLPQRVYKVGNDPTSVAIADVTGDGIPDIIVTNGGDNTVSILLGNPSGQGNGRGTFQPAMTFATGGDPVSVQAADLNGDGKTDLVTANATGDSLSVLLGNGDGTFGPAQNIPLGVSPASVATGSTTSVNPNAPDLAKQDVIVAATGASSNDPNSVYGSQILVLPNINTSQPGISLQNGILNLVGTSGNDTISLSLDGDSVTAQIDSVTKTYPLTDVGMADVAGLAGNDSITIGAGLTIPVNAGGQAGNDTIIASNAANDTLSGGRGADSLVGGSGNNFISGGPGNDTLIAGTGNDTLRGGGGNDSINGRGGGNDVLSGGPGSDSLVGTALTGSNIDTIIGGAGSDSLIVSMRDILVLPGPGGDDTITGP